MASAKAKQESVPTKSLFKSTLQKFFGGRSKLQKPHQADKVNSVYLGDVLDGTGSVILEGGPLPLDQKLFEMVEKYKSEARAAAPPSPARQAEELQGPSTPPAVLEDGIAEVVPSNRDLRLPSVGEIQPAPLPSQSPLSTLSSINIHSMPYVATNSEVLSKDYHSNPLFLESHASDGSLHLTTQGDDAYKDRILDTWDDALFGPPVEPLFSEVDGSVTISVAVALPGLSGPGGKRMSPMRTLPEVAARGELSSKESSRSAHSRHSQGLSPKARRPSVHKLPGHAGAGPKPVQEVDRRQQHGDEAQPSRRDTDWGLASAEDIHARGDTAQQGARRHGHAKPQEAEPRTYSGSGADERVGPMLDHTLGLLSTKALSKDPAIVESGTGNRWRELEQHIPRHPRQQRREARQHQREAAHNQAQQQGPGAQPGAHAESRFAKGRQQQASRVQPLQDVTRQQANLRGHLVGPNKVVVPPLKAGKGILSKYGDMEEALDASWEQQLAGGSDSDSSQILHPHKSKRRLDKRSNESKGPGARRVHFGDEGTPAERAEVRNRLPSQTGARESSATVASEQRSVSRKLLGSRDSIKTSQSWSDDNAQELLAEAFAVSGSLSKKGQGGHQDGPVLSPGRFLKLASLTEEGEQEWDSKVSVQMELAAKLAEQRPGAQVAPAAASQLHCASDGVTALLRQPPAVPSPPRKRFSASLVKQQPAAVIAKPPNKEASRRVAASNARPSSAARNQHAVAANKPPCHVPKAPAEATSSRAPVPAQPSSSEAAAVAPQSVLPPGPFAKALPSPPVKFAPSAAVRDGTKMARIIPNGPPRHSLNTGANSSSKPAERKPVHAASHSSTQLLMREAASKSQASQPLPANRVDEQHSSGKEYMRQSELYAAAQRAIWQGSQSLPALATRPQSGPMHHFPAGSAPLLGSEDPLRETYDPQDLDSYPVSVPASPSSMVSVHGHALSTLTMSPSRYTASLMNTPLEEPWTPQMHDVAEENTEDFASLKGVSEYSGNGAASRTGLATEPSVHLTQAMLDTQAVLDTVACDVDLSWLGPLWPPGGTPKMPHDAAKAHLYHQGMYHRDAETISAPRTPASDTLGAKKYLLHSTPSDWMRNQPYKDSWPACR